MTTDKMPFNAVEEEKAVLGSCLIDKEAVYTVAEILQVGDFYKSHHNKIYEAVIELYKKSIEVDYLTVTDQLEKMNVLEEVGGAYYVTQLAEAVPSAASVKYYAEIVLNAAMLRNMNEYAIKTQEEIQELKDGQEVLANQQQRLIDLGQRNNRGKIVRAGEMLPGVMTLLEQARDGMPGLDTGIKALNDMIGGLQKETYIIVAGRPSMGKTALGLKFVRTAAINHGIPAAVISLEMSSTKLSKRILLSESKVNMQRANSGKLGADDWVKLSGKVELVDKAPIYLIDTPHNELTIRSTAQRMKMQYGIELLVIDYLQLGKLAKRYERRSLEIGALSATCNDLKKEIGIPVVALCQLNREGDGRRPLLSHLKESGDIEQDADVVIFPYRPGANDESVEESKLEIIVAKQRDGETGIIDAVWCKEYGEFYDVEKHYDEYQYHDEKVF